MCIFQAFTVYKNTLSSLKSQNRFGFCTSSRIDIFNFLSNFHYNNQVLVILLTNVVSQHVGNLDSHL